MTHTRISASQEEGPKSLATEFWYKGKQNGTQVKIYIYTFLWMADVHVGHVTECPFVTARLGHGRVCELGMLLSLSDSIGGERPATDNK